ncbi:MAG: AzlD domain-containing protein [Deltaproteobacteria bacterium]|jgi:branched-subunit amino acid transport protein|nr:AzlD domain-containing protein [Deltaproteobacteria bacterium]
MNTWELLLCFTGMGLVTALPRILPLTLLAGRVLPQAFAHCLSFVPAAVLAALLAPELLVRGGTLSLGPDNFFLLAAGPTFWVAWRGNGIFAPIATGMAAVALARALCA